MILTVFGRHLHNQIVGPLILAILVVAVLATVVAVSLVGSIINDWIDQNANSTSSTVIARLQEEAVEDVERARLAAEFPALVAAVDGGDRGAISAQLVVVNQSLDADNLMLVDGDGTVIASTGALGIAPGDRPFEQTATGELSPEMNRPVLIEIAGVQTIAALQPMRGPSAAPYVLVLSTSLTDEYVGWLAGGTAAAVAVYDARGSLVASANPSTDAGEALGAGLSADESRIKSAIALASEGSGPSEAIGITGGTYRAVARKVTLSDDPESGSLYTVTTVDTDVADDARITTTRLIVAWSVIAVFMLMGLGWWVAHSVSSPLAALSENAARVAEGDFAAKVPVAGANEITDLFVNFNRMTDSLRDRTEALTKKVLELATLYEMSRSLGSTLELDALLDSVLESALRIFDVEIGYVTMVDRETGALGIRAWKGADLSNTSDVTVRSSMSEWVIREGRPLIFNPQTKGGEESRGDAVSGALAALCVPLPSSEGTIGSITVGSRSPDQRFTSDDVRLLATIANHVTIAIGNIELFSSVQEAYLATVRALAAAVDAKDPYTRGHSNGVATYALRIGETLGFSADQMVALEMAAYLHDIGKIGISEDILLKPGKLTEDEMNQMRHHPLIGANILKPVAFPWPIAPIVRHHHEHYNGEGYPAGLRTEEIPILARVLAVADAFDAMVADRPYRRGRSRQEAVLELRRCSGAQFDPRVVEAFIEVLARSEEQEVVPIDVDAGIGPDEIQAVYTAICDGMFACFRRLGGPRLANNLERSVNESLRAERVPYVVQSGRLVLSDPGHVDDECIDLIRAVALMSEGIERASGAGLADHFLEEALEALPERMRAHAEGLGFTPSS